HAPSPLSPTSSLFHAPAPTPLYALSLHDALPISRLGESTPRGVEIGFGCAQRGARDPCTREHLLEAEKVRARCRGREYQHDSRQIGRAPSELQSLAYLVCRLLLEKKNKKKRSITS